MNSFDRTAPREALARALGRDVAPTWIGQPPSGLFLRAIDALLIPLSVAWFGFALFWEKTVVEQDAPLVFRLVGAAFVVAGSIFVLGRFFIDAYLRAHTVYAVTDDEAYIVRSGPFSRAVTFDLGSTAPIEMTRRDDGTGTVTFGPKSPMAEQMSMWGVRPMREFEGIPHVAQVYQLVTGRASGPESSRKATLALDDA